MRVLSRVLNAIIFDIDEQCNLIFETALFSNCKMYIIFFIQWNPLSFLLCLSHFRFFPVSPFLCSLSLPLLNVSTSKPMVDSQWPSKSQTHGWFVTDPKSTTNHHRNGPREQTVAAHDEQQPHGHSRDLNQPTATHAIWSHPRQSTVIWTHPWPPTATHSDLNPTHDEPQPPLTHGNLNPTPIWSLQADLEREEKLSLWEKERRERDGSTSGFAGGDNGGGFFFLFLFCLFFLLWLVVVGGCGGYGCGCGGFFLLWFFFLFFLVVVISGRAKIKMKY